MNTIILGLESLRPLRATRWTHFGKRFREWRERARTRRELMHLSHGDLRDIGASTCDAANEGSKPFWREQLNPRIGHGAI